MLLEVSRKPIAGIQQYFTKNGFELLADVKEDGVFDSLHEKDEHSIANDALMVDLTPSHTNDVNMGDHIQTPLAVKNSGEKLLQLIKTIQISVV